MPRAGIWTFKDTAAPSVAPVLITLTKGDQSELVAAFATAVTALAPTANTTLVGLDPHGRPHPYRNFNN